jgi:hypothetical protein
MCPSMTYPGYQNIRTTADGQVSIEQIYSMDACTRKVLSNHKEDMLHAMTLRMDLRMQCATNWEKESCAL